MSKFNIGEIAIHAPLEGINRECEVIEGESGRLILIDGEMTFWPSLYLVMFSTGEIITCSEQYLRKINPDRETTTTWDQCIWKPEGVTS